MPAVITDIIDGASVRVDQNGQTTIDRVYHVAGLPETSEPAARLLAALTAQDPDTLETVPQRLDPHPTIPELLVRDIEAQPLANDNAMATVRVTYGPNTGTITNNDPPPPETDGSAQIEVGGTLETIETNYNHLGQLMLSQYTPPGSAEASIAVVTAQASYPRYVRRATTRESTSPEAKARTYLGATNSLPWGGGQPREWLCTALSGRKGADDIWTVSYEFIFRPSRTIDSTTIPGWDFVAVYEDPSGQTPDDVQIGNGASFYTLYPSEDFNLLFPEAP